MVQINFAQKAVNVKIVYYGPGMSGKTTNLEVVHQKAPDTNRGDLTSIATDGDRTLFFDYMPLDLGTVSGMRTQFQIYTVPGQVYYNSTRKLVLQGVDGVIFVADSSASMVEENIESLNNLRENLAEYGKDLDALPYVIQYNKRDLPDALPIEELDAQLNPNGVPTYEAVASSGQGVFPTLKALAAYVLDTIHTSQASGGGSAGGSSTSAFSEPPPAPNKRPASPPVHSMGTGFYPAGAAQSETPAPPPAPAVSSAPPAPAAPMAPAASDGPGLRPVFAPNQAATPPAASPATAAGVPAGFPQPAGPPPVTPGMPASGAALPPGMDPGGLRMAHGSQRSQSAPEHAAAVMPVATNPAPPQQQTHPLLSPATGAPPPQAQQQARASRPAPPPPASSPSSSTRLKPRSAALPTPRRKNSVLTGAFVVLALVAGVVLGSLVFNLF